MLTLVWRLLIPFLFLLQSLFVTSSIKDCLIFEELSFCYKPNCIKVIDSYENHKTIVLFLEDASGKKFVLKQMKRGCLRQQFCLIREALASYIAESINVPVNRVRIISPEIDFPGKVFKERAATLHTFAPGLDVDRRGPYPYLKIKQKYDTTWPEHKLGLTKDVIQKLTKHSDLPVIAAFDTFINNSDRAPHNLFYYEKTNRFCGIDHEISFNKNLSILAHKQIIRLLRKTIFSHSEICALKRYKNTLQKLITYNPPEKTCAYLDKFFVIAGFEYGIDNDFDKYVQLHKRRIYESYASVQKLVRLLDQLIDQYISIDIK